MARRKREHSPGHSTDEQRSQPGCIGGENGELFLDGPLTSSAASSRSWSAARPEQQEQQDQARRGERGRANRARRERAAVLGHRRRRVGRRGGCSRSGAGGEKPYFKGRVVVDRDDGEDELAGRAGVGDVEPAEDPGLVEGHGLVRRAAGIAARDDRGEARRESLAPRRGARNLDAQGAAARRQELDNVVSARPGRGAPRAPGPARRCRCRSGAGRSPCRHGPRSPPSFIA